MKIKYLSIVLIVFATVLSCKDNSEQNGSGSGDGSIVGEPLVVSDDPAVLFVHEGEDLASILESLPEEVKEVRIGAGTFKGNFVMKEGVSVSGSWNRDFTDSKGITTILDACGKGIVLTQKEPFTETAVWKNLRLTGGYVTTADTHGAGAWLKAGGSLEGCEVCYNINIEDGNCGGGIYADAGSSVIRCHIHDNGGNRGGGIFTKGTVSFCVVEKNMANGKGGGIGVFGGNDTGSRGIVYNCLVKDNSGSEGGGIHVERYGTVYNCLVTGNTAMRNVGGIQTNGSYGCNIINCTVVDNTDPEESEYSSAICCSEHGVLINNVTDGRIIVNNKYLFFFNNACPNDMLLQKVSPWKAERHSDSSHVYFSSLSSVLDGDYVPVTGSSLVDKGIEEISVSGHEDGVVPDWTDKDYSGRARRTGNAIDIGCNELQL